MKISIPGDEELFSIGEVRIDVSSVSFSPIPDAIEEVTWLGSGATILFSTPQCAVALVKVCAVTTRGDERTGTRVESCLVSITEEADRFIINAATWRRAVPRSDLPADATPETLVEPARVIAEHRIEGLHDGRLSSAWMELSAAPAIAKTTYLQTSRSRPIGIALLMAAPPGAWCAQITPTVAFIRPSERLSHVFIVEHATPAVLCALRCWSADYPFAFAEQQARCSNSERDVWVLLLVDERNAVKLISSGDLERAHRMVDHILYEKPL